MIIGLVSIVLSLLVLLQSCAAGVYDTMSETGDLGGSAGFLVFLIMMIAGIVAIVTRKSEKKKTGIIIGAIYIFGGLIAFPHSVVFTDLKIWGGVCIFFGLYFLGSFLYADDEEEKTPIFEFKCDKCSTTVKRGDTICPECGAEVSTKIKPIDVIAILEGSESYDIEEFERVTVIGTLLKDEYGGAIIVVESIEVQDDGAIY